MIEKKLIIDAKGSVLGRVASYAAKQALLGKEIMIINCSEALLTGKRKSIINEYNQARARGGSSQKGPFFPKHSERVMKRTIRGMLNYQQQKGLEAFRRIKCYPDSPEEFKNMKKISLVRIINARTMPLKELSSEI